MDKFRNKYRISSARLPAWNYAWSGLYYVTICTNPRVPHFGCVVMNRDGEPILQRSEIGLIVEETWNDIPKHFPFALLDSFRLMPDHLHGIIGLQKKEEPLETSNPRGGRKGALGTVMGSFKSAVTLAARKLVPDFTWQERYWDHIIRDNHDLVRIREYMDDNLRKWWDKFGAQD